jgi:hypothetical protein
VYGETVHGIDHFLGPGVVRPPYRQAPYVPTGRAPARISGISAARISGSQSVDLPLFIAQGTRNGFGCLYCTSALPGSDNDDCAGGFERRLEAFGLGFSARTCSSLARMLAKSMSEPRSPHALEKLLKSCGGKRDQS